VNKRKGLLRRDDSELLMAVGPLEVYGGSNLMLGDGRNEGPEMRPFYTVAINPCWLDDSGEVELCIDGTVRIVGTSEPPEEDADLFVQVGKLEDKYNVRVLDKSGSASTHLQLERVLGNESTREEERG
jgi:hypothetical protein